MLLMSGTLLPKNTMITVSTPKPGANNLSAIIAGGRLHSLFDRPGLLRAVASVVAFPIAVVARDVGAGFGAAAVAAFA